MGATWRQDLFDRLVDRNHAELLRRARSGELAATIGESRRLEKLTVLARYRFRSATGSPTTAV